MSESVGFIGLGSMGFPIARNLLTSGYRIRVFNPTKATAMPLVKAGATLVDREEEVLETGGLVFSILSDDDAVRTVTVGKAELLRRPGPGGIHRPLSTISP